MQEQNETNSKMPETARAEAGVNETLLRSEIAFWREMLASCDPDQPPDSIERMHHALALAELRLQQLFKSFQESSKDRPGNVFYLQRGRHSTN